MKNTALLACKSLNAFCFTLHQYRKKGKIKDRRKKYDSKLVIKRLLEMYLAKNMSLARSKPLLNRTVLRKYNCLVFLTGVGGQGKGKSNTYQGKL